MRNLLISGLSLFLCFATTSLEAKTKNPVVRLETNYGDIILELYPEQAPITVKNFLAYAEEGYYNGTVFHRVINGFMIQGGGFEPGLKQRQPTHEPIQNEAHNLLPNERGTLAMARTSLVDSATSQFFINLADNAYLNHQNKSTQGFGYAVFGKVISGMEAVDSIAEVKTTRVGNYMDVPKDDVLINKAIILRR